MNSTPLALFFKSHVKGYTRRDGTAVRPHEDKRQAATADAKQSVLFFRDVKEVSPPDYSNLSNNQVMQTNDTTMEDFPITRSAISGKTIALFDDAIKQLNTAGPIIKARYAELRQDISRIYERGADNEISKPYLAVDFDNRPEWFNEVYYDCQSMASLKKCKRACQAHAGDPLADRALAYFAEWEPVIAKLDARKAEITTAAAQRDVKKVAERKAKELVPPTKLSLLVNAAVDAHKPQVAADFRNYVTERYSRLVKDLGPKLEGMWEKENESRRKFFENTVRPLVGKDIQIDPAKLQARSDEYADAVADAMRGKIMGKAGDLADPEIKDMDGMNFQLVGTMGGKKILIEQNTIVNVSPLGTMFNQFPARIYVDGKFTPEAGFKKIQLGLA